MAAIISEPRGQQFGDFIALLNSYQLNGEAGKILSGEANEAVWKKVDYLKRDLLTLPLENVLSAIEKSRWILKLKDDWDDEGSSSYTEATWGRAIDFLVQSSWQLQQRYSVTIDSPQILPGPNGSIDIHWKKDGTELLINIPSKENEPADFYGDNKFGQQVKGNLDISMENQWLLMWLMQ